MNLSDLFTPEVTQTIKLILILVALFHVVIGFILFNFVMAVGKTAQMPFSAVVKLVSSIHILVLVGILIIVFII